MCWYQSVQLLQIVKSIRGVINAYLYRALASNPSCRLHCIVFYCIIMHRIMLSAVLPAPTCVAYVVTLSTASHIDTVSATPRTTQVKNTSTCKRTPTNYLQYRQSTAMSHCWQRNTPATCLGLRVNQLIHGHVYSTRLLQHCQDVWCACCALGSTDTCRNHAIIYAIGL